ncbi:hypothetical protein O181_117147, partial [Austropuccinia psidii MF-1]|nr:hypothetical protein [Austropuccinia psidii MF-1]
TPSEPEGSKGKGKRHSEGLITAKKWTPIATQKSSKPQNSASIQGKLTLITCTGKITIINPVVTSIGKLPQSADNKFVQGTDKEILASKGTSQRTEKACPEPEDLKGDTLDTVVDGKTMREIMSTLPFTLQFNGDLKPEDWKDMDQVLQLHQLPKDLFQWSMDNKAQPGISLGTTWSKLPEDLSQRDRLQRPYDNYQRLQSYQAVQTPGGKGTEDKGVSNHYPSCRRTVNPHRAYSDSFRLTRSRKNQLPSAFRPFRRQQINDQESPLYTIPEVVGFGERSAQEPEVVVNHSRISRPSNRNITPTQTEHNIVTSESNINNDTLCLQISQYAEQSEKQFAELDASHERTKKLTASMDKIIQNIQEGHDQLRKSSEETNKRLNLVFEEQHHSRRDRDFLDQDINKLLNVYHKLKHQPQGQVMENPYQPDDIKPHAMLMNKSRSSSQYQDGDGMSYLEKEALEQLPEASSWPKFSGTGEYYHMELIDYIDGLFIDVPNIPDYWITA